MQTAQQLSALSSKDGQQWWGLTGCVGSLPLDTPHPDVRRLVLGDLSTGAVVEVSETLRSLLQNLQAAFPRLTHLHLWNVRQLTHLGGLPASLQCLDLRGCRELLKIDPLPDSARLQLLDLADCAQLTALPEADYSRLTRVWLHGCLSLLSFQPLLAAVPSLKHLELHDCRFQDLDTSLCGVPGENVVDKVRQHFQALRDQTEVPFAECKLIVLGDGGVGKTSLVRAILGEDHNPDEPITHGIGLWRWNGAAHGQQPPVLFPERSDAQLTLNIWDFGGQDLYHNTHRLFMETQAVFIVVERWKDPDKPRRPQNPKDIDRPLQYWLEQVAAANAGSQHKPRVLIVRTAIDDQTQKHFALAPWQERVKTKFHEHCYFELSCLDNQRDTEAWKTFRSTLLE